MSNEVRTGRVYDQTLNRDYVLEIIDQINRHHHSEQQTNELIKAVLNYMQSAKQDPRDEPHPETSSPPIKVLADKTSRVESEVALNNQATMESLEYLCGNGQRQGHSFLSLIFDLSLEESKKVGEAA